MIKVVCVVVTFNRKELLNDCIGALLNQTRSIDKILIIDNASTDGTKEFINEKLGKNSKIEFLSLEKNIGGAGGFNEGLQHALEKTNYDWFWMMDDDGYPNNDCLEMLIHTVSSKYLDAIAPVQLNINHKTDLAFPLTVNGMKFIGEYSKISHLSYIPSEANLFNGLLISRKVIENIGLPRSELFIRGDEVEYTKRLRKYNLKFGTLIPAIFYHPSDINERINILCGLWNIRDAHSDFKNYYMFRNRAVAFLEDGNAMLLPLDFIRYSYYFMIHKKFDWKGLKLWCHATYDGVRGKLGRHPKY